MGSVTSVNKLAIVTGPEKISLIIHVSRFDFFTMHRMVMYMNKLLKSHVHNKLYLSGLLFAGCFFEPQWQSV